MEPPENTREARDLLRVVNSPDWEIPAGAEKSLPLLLYQMAMEKRPDGSYRYGPRERIRAIEALRRFQADNDRKAEAGRPDLVLHAATSIEEIRQEMLHDPQYLEYLRDREEDGDPGDVRPEGEPRDMDLGPPSPED